MSSLQEVMQELFETIQEEVPYAPTSPEQWAIASERLFSAI